MSYLIKTFDKYYLRIGSTTADEVYDPSVATQFRIKKEANEWIEKNFSMKEYCKIVKRDQEVKSFKQWCEQGMIRRVLQLVDQKSSVKYNGQDKEDIFRWWAHYRKQPEGTVTQEVYNSWPNLYEVFTYIHCLQSYASHDYSQRFYTFEICVPPNGKFEDFKKEWDFVNKEMKITHKDDDGNLVVDIFDHFLCEGGNSAKLLIHPNGKFSVEERWGGGINRVTLKEAFKFIKKNRWYGERQDDEDDDD
jgi:hypothetical protein